MARMLGALCAPHVPPALLRLTWGVPAAHSPDAASGQSTQPEPSAAPQHLPGAPRCPRGTPGASTLQGWLLMPVVGALGPAARLALHGDPCMGCTPVSPRCPMSPWLQCLNLASLQPLHWEHSPRPQQFSWLSQGWGHGAGGQGSGTDPGRSQYCRAWPATRGPRRLSLRAAGPRTAVSWSWPLARRSLSTGSTGTTPPMHRELQHSTRPSRHTWPPGLQPPCVPSSWHRGVLEVEDPLCPRTLLGMAPWHSCTFPAFAPYQPQAGSSDAMWLPARLLPPCWVPNGVHTVPAHPGAKTRAQPLPCTNHITRAQLIWKQPGTTQLPRHPKRCSVS